MIYQQEKRRILSHQGKEQIKTSNQKEYRMKRENLRKMDLIHLQQKIKNISLRTTPITIKPNQPLPQILKLLLNQLQDYHLINNVLPNLVNLDLIMKMLYQSSHLRLKKDSPHQIQTKLTRIVTSLLLTCVTLDTCTFFQFVMVTAQMVIMFLSS
jgi:hypothetical protein